MKKYHMLRVPIDLWDDITEKADEESGLKSSQCALGLLRSALKGVVPAGIVNKPARVKKTKKAKTIQLTKLLVYNNDDDINIEDRFSWVYEGNDDFLCFMKELALAGIRTTNKASAVMNFKLALVKEDHVLTEFDDAKEGAEQACYIIESFRNSTTQLNMSGENRDYLDPILEEVRNA